MGRLAEAAAALFLAAGAAVAAPDPPPAAAPLRFGVVTFYNPRSMFQKYQPLVDYLSTRTGVPWELAISGSYESTVEALCSGRLAIAYLGPSTYVRAQDECAATPIVKLVTGGRPTYRSIIVVRDGSPIRKLADLKGRSFGFGSPLSTSSHLMPRAMLQAAGVRPGVDFACRYYMHHESAVRAVLLGEVDAAGVRDIVAEKYLGHGLRVVARSEDLPNFPFVASPKTPRLVTEQVIRVLVTLPASDPGARETIAGWDEELSGGFALAASPEYEPLRALADRVFGHGWEKLPERALECRGEP
jgi:phosphonate transport system substrate-binding protein